MLPLPHSHTWVPIGTPVVGTYTASCGDFAVGVALMSKFLGFSSTDFPGAPAGRGDTITVVEGVQCEEHKCETWQCLPLAHAEKIITLAQYTGKCACGDPGDCANCPEKEYDEGGEG